MKIISEIYDDAFTREELTGQSDTCTVRRAARAILFDKSGNIAMMKVTRDGYHKLPGGGIEENEDIMSALERELMEEVGTKAKVVNEIGIIIEYKNQFRQISYCYVAEAYGEQSEVSFTQEEKNKGFVLQWMNFEEAIDTLEKDKPLTKLGGFIRQRDLTFLKYFKENGGIS